MEALLKRAKPPPEPPPARTRAVPVREWTAEGVAVSGPLKRRVPKPEMDVLCQVVGPETTMSPDNTNAPEVALNTVRVPKLIGPETASVPLVSARVLVPEAPPETNAAADTGELIVTV
jgi:hypothetical protein